MNRERRNRPGEQGRQRDKERRRAWEKDRDFLAIDGEAVSGKYVLLAASDGSFIEDPDGLKTTDCLRFLTSRDVKTLWTFAMDYDVNMILAGLEEPALYRLTLNKHRTFYGDFQIEHIPGKQFKVLNMETGIRVTVWDVFSFVRTNFVDWLRDWKLADPQEIESIREMKNRRAVFTPAEMPDIRKYCFQELKYLQAGVLELMDRVEKTGYHPAAWYSPASVSVTVMRKKGVKEHLGKQSEKVQKIAQAAYYGGRFETRVIGQLQAPLFQYDINSAYPAALEHLPCLDCGSWHYNGSMDLDDPLSLVEVTWKTRNSYRRPQDRQPWGPLPIRLSNGSLRYPLVCEQPRWYWAFEVRAALPLARFKIHHACRYQPGCSDRPFAWVRELYDQRQELKRQGDPAEYVLKLILNSTYGKLAQRPRRGSDRMPLFHSPVWAGMVTAHTRAQILGAIAQDPGAVLQIATDGLTSRRELPNLPVSKELGEWGMTPLEMLFILQSGIYWWKDEKGKRVQKSRGFHPASMTYARCLSHWKRSPETPMRFETSRFLGYRVALQRDRLAEWRTWPTFGVSISLTPEPRRERAFRQDGYLVSAPPIRAEEWMYDVAGISAFENEWEPGDQPDGPEGDGGL